MALTIVLVSISLDGVVALAARDTLPRPSAVALLGKTAIPSVAAQAVLLEEMADDEWWTTSPCRCSNRPGSSCGAWCV